MATTFQRAPLTAYLLDHIQTDTTFPCGDGVFPKGSGWGTQQPNKPGSSFSPFTVLTTMTARPAPMEGPITNPQEDWHITYLIQSFGQARIQTETLADLVRKTIGLYKLLILDLHTNYVPDPNNFKIAEVWWDSIGGINVTPQTDPPFYGEQDQFTLVLKKRQT